MTLLSSFAPAKVNLSLRVLGKRADGYHEIASIVAFADIGDALTLEPGSGAAISVTGPFAAMTGADESNLVLKAARALSERVENLRAGHFALVKNLPAGAGLGGGSSDAAAALRLLAELNGLGSDDPRLMDAAKATGADVSVCLDPKARLMHGIGDILSAPLKLPNIPAILVFPSAPVATAPVFAALDLKKISIRKDKYKEDEIPREPRSLIEFLKKEPNDLEEPASRISGAITEASEAIGKTNPLLVRMSGSGSTVFAIYQSSEKAEAAGETIRAKKQGWWVQATTLT